ncbi:MAG: efflux RND transporter periplasmic adaptor subunit [Legionellales bacterium]|nr:efflux RND transporter periplasmic adaptor subunit [Legionellales bacterium]
MKKANQIVIFIITCVWLSVAAAGGDHDHVMHKQPITQQKQVYHTHNKEAIKNQQNSHNDGDHNEEPVVVLSSTAREQNQIKIATAQSQHIEQMLPVFGKIVPIQNKQIDIYPRFAGVVKSLPYRLGDHVEKGNILATIESNESLQNYTIKVPFSGTLIKQHVNVGKLVKPEQAIYELADLSSVWVDLFVYRKDASHVSKDDKVYVNLENNKSTTIESHLHYISPVGNEHTQSIIARATLPNKEMKWIPGLYVDAQIVITSKKVSVAVSRDAIQTLDGKTVVFVETKPNTFSPERVTLGLKDHRFVQVVSGIQSGMRYVSKNSFILKAELEKSSAEHSH